MGCLRRLDISSSFDENGDSDSYANPKSDPYSCRPPVGYPPLVSHLFGLFFSSVFSFWFNRCATKAQNLQNYFPGVVADPMQKNIEHYDWDRIIHFF